VAEIEAIITAARPIRLKFFIIVFLSEA
jgi:hypothetical protein